MSAPAVALVINHDPDCDHERPVFACNGCIARHLSGETCTTCGRRIPDDEHPMRAGEITICEFCIEDDDE